MNEIVLKGASVLASIILLLGYLNMVMGVNTASYSLLSMLGFFTCAALYGAAIYWAANLLRSNKGEVM